MHEYAPRTSVTDPSAGRENRFIGYYFTCCTSLVIISFKVELKRLNNHCPNIMTRHLKESDHDLMSMERRYVLDYFSYKEKYFTIGRTYIILKLHLVVLVDCSHSVADNVTG